MGISSVFFKNKLIIALCLNVLLFNNVSAQASGSSYEEMYNENIKTISPSDIILLMQRAQDGDENAQSDLGSLYLSGHNNLKKDFDRAFYWTSKSIDNGNKVSHFNMGLIHQLGLGVDVDLKKAASHFKIAADEGVSMAMFNFSVLKLNIAESEEDFQEVFEYMEGSSESGFLEAKNNLAMMYLKGIGVEENQEKAMILIKESALAGDPQAQYNLSNAYYAGQGVKKDLVKSFKWVKKQQKVDFLLRSTI